MKKLIESAQRFFNPNSDGTTARGPSEAAGLPSTAPAGRMPHDTGPSSPPVPVSGSADQAMTPEARAHLTRLRREHGHALGSATFEIELTQHRKTVEAFERVRAQLTEIDAERERIYAQCREEILPLEQQAQTLFDQYHDVLRAIADRRVEFDQALAPLDARKVELMRSYTIPADPWPLPVVPAE